MAQSYKGRENRLRRAALRQGLVLERSRRHDVRALSYGRYLLRHMHTTNFVNEPGPYDRHTWTLDEVEHYLLTGEPLHPEEEARAAKLRQRRRPGLA